MKHTEKIIRSKKEDQLKCSYCGRLSPLGTSNCPQCGAVLSEDDIVTVSVQKTEDSTETINNIDDIIDNVLDEREKKNRIYVISIIASIVIVAGLCVWIFKSKDSTPEVENQAITVETTTESFDSGIHTGYVLPNGAILISQRQVPLENNPSKYRTEYTYTFDEDLSSQ